MKNTKSVKTTYFILSIEYIYKIETIPFIVPLSSLQVRMVFLEKVLLDSRQIRQKVFVPIDRGHVELESVSFGAIRLTQYCRQIADISIVNTPVAQPKVRHHVYDATQFGVTFGVAGKQMIIGS